MSVTVAKPRPHAGFRTARLLHIATQKAPIWASKVLFWVIESSLLQTEAPPPARVHNYRPPGVVIHRLSTAFPQVIHKLSTPSSMLVGYTGGFAYESKAWHRRQPYGILTPHQTQHHRTNRNPNAPQKVTPPICSPYVASNGCLMSYVLCGVVTYALPIETLNVLT
jgi:hypothetical protein